MTDFTDSDLRIKSFNDALDTYDLAKKHCVDLARGAQRAADLLNKPSPIPAQRTAAPPPMPHQQHLPRAINFPTEAEINTAIHARDASRDTLVAAWDMLTTKERARVVPPDELNLKHRRNDS